MPKQRCTRCPHKWNSFVENPVKCPKCGSPYWNLPRQRDTTETARVIARNERGAGVPGGIGGGYHAAEDESDVGVHVPAAAGNFVKGPVPRKIKATTRAEDPGRELDYNV